MKKIYSVKKIYSGKSLDVTDSRTPRDYGQQEGFDVLKSVFTDNIEAWEDFISYVLLSKEFDTPMGLKKIDMRLLGQRLSFLGQAFRDFGYIKLTPHFGYDVRDIYGTVVHELGHIVVPIYYKGSNWNQRRVVHGKAFKEATYRLAQHAYAVGLLLEDEVHYDLGLSYRKNNAAATKEPPVVIEPRFSVGDVISWWHEGYKHGGLFIGRIDRVNKKTYMVSQLSKNGRPSGNTIWRLYIKQQKRFKLIEEEG